MKLVKSNDIELKELIKNVYNEGLTNTGVFIINNCVLRHDKIGFNIGTPSISITLCGEWQIFTKSTMLDLLETILEDKIETILKDNQTNTTKKAVPTIPTIPMIPTKTMAWKNVVSRSTPLSTLSTLSTPSALSTLSAPSMHNTNSTSNTRTYETTLEEAESNVGTVKVSTLLYDKTCFEPPLSPLSPLSHESQYGIEPFIMKVLRFKIDDSVANTWINELTKSVIVMGYQLCPQFVNVEEHMYGVKLEMKCSAINVGDHANGHTSDVKLGSFLASQLWTDLPNTNGKLIQLLLWIDVD